MTDTDLPPHLYRDFIRPDPHGKGYARCWCGWHSKWMWNESFGWAEHQDHQRDEVLYGFMKSTRETQE